MPRAPKQVFICVQERPPQHPRGSCGAKGSKAVFDRFFQEMGDRQLWGQISVTYSGCIGPCGMGPSVLVYPDAVMYGGVTPEDVPEIFDSHLLGGEPVARLRVPEDIW